MQVRDARERLARLGADSVAVGFSPPRALAALADDLAWPGPFLADAERQLYARLGLGRASWRQLASPGTLRVYRDAARRGVEVRRPVEDARQMGGDAVVRRGRAVRVFRPRHPDDRPSVDQLVAATAEVAAEPDRPARGGHR